MAEASTASTESKRVPPATKWWQWVLVYSGLGTGLVTGFPRIWEEYKAFRLGIARSQLALVQEQERLWQRNLECIQAQGSYEVDGPQGMVIRVTLCQTGDALIRYHLNEWPPIYRWVALPVKHVKKGEKIATEAPHATP